MLSIAEKIGEQALADSSFILSRNIFTSAFAVMLILLIIAVCLTVVKPRVSK
jgi:hypothetical protein